MNNRFLNYRQKLRLLEFHARKKNFRRTQNIRKQINPISVLKKRQLTPKYDQVTVGDYQCPKKFADRIENLQNEISYAEEERDFEEVAVLGRKVEVLLEHGCVKML